MKAKSIDETLNEWVYSDTGTNMYSPEYVPTQIQEPEKNQSEPDFSRILPPENYKFTPEEFSSYIDELLSIFTQSPLAAISIFKTILRSHRYLTKKPIGFKTINPFEDSIDKFLIQTRM